MEHKLSATLDAIRDLLYKVEQKISIDLPDQFLNSVTLIAGFLVIAAFPLVTQDFSSDPKFQPVHFSPRVVRSFAAISVGLFLTDIISCQAAKLLFLVLDEWHHREKAGQAKHNNTQQTTPDIEKHSTDPDSSVSHTRIFLLVALLELLATAILFLLLIVAAYVYVLGMVFLVLDGLFALGCLSLLWNKTVEEAMNGAMDKVRDTVNGAKDQVKDAVNGADAKFRRTVRALVIATRMKMNNSEGSTK